ncbi:hypothetical protein FRC12_019277 [Ceratobasidium sp. 428]|nr:hypothetical protein FRC12_019277 [Ceratobasidium sp. 428]
MDKSALIPIVHQHLINKATELLDYVASPKSQPENNPLTKHTPELKYCVDDLTELLSEMHKLGVDAPETAQLESLSWRVYDFQQKTRHLLLELEVHKDSDDTASLVRLEKLVAIGQGLWLRLDELAKLEPLVTRLRVFRDLQTTEFNRLTLEQAEALILRGQGVNVPPNHQAMAELARKVAAGRKWEARATSVLAQPRPGMKDLNQLLAFAHSIPTSPNVLDKVNQIWLRGRKFEEKVEACLKPPRETPVSINNANQLAIAVLGEVYFPAAEELRTLSTEARMWEETCGRIMAGRFEAGGAATAFDEFRAMRDEGKAKFWPFRMPWFKKMVGQLSVHDEWISRLPWTRPGLNAALDLEGIARDLTGDGDAESTPPTNEACTCICAKPVVVGKSPHDTKVAQCDHCLVRFHAKCIEGSCPFCDDQTWNRLMGEPPMFKRQHLYSQYATACKLTQHYSPEYRALKVILYGNGECALTKAITRFIKQLARQESPDPAAILQIRHLMRRLYRIQLEISPRPEIFAYGLSLAHLHRQMAMQSRIKQTTCQKPKFVFKTEMDPRASDGSRCLCSGAQSNTPSWLLTCNKCQSWYHEACIAVSSGSRVPLPFVCPLCLLKEGKGFGLAEVRVTYHGEFLFYFS